MMSLVGWLPYQRMVYALWQYVLIANMLLAFRSEPTVGRYILKRYRSLFHAEAFALREQEPDPLITASQENALSVRLAT